MILILRCFFNFLAPDGVTNMYSPGLTSRAPLRPPGAPPQLGHPSLMVQSPTNPSMMSGVQMQASQQLGPGAPQMVPSLPQMGPGTPQMGPGTPQMGPGTPPMGPGTPQMGPGKSHMGPGMPKMGPGTPQMGPGTPQMASPRIAQAPNQMSPGAPQMPNISQAMSLSSPQMVMGNPRGPIAPKLEPPDNMDSRTMWLPKRMNHCKLYFLFIFFLFISM